MAWKRYKDPKSGDEFTADERAGLAMGLKPLAGEGTDVYGRPITADTDTNKSDKKDG
jgi:hypothetical protein